MADYIMKAGGESLYIGLDDSAIPLPADANVGEIPPGQAWMEATTRIEGLSDELKVKQMARDFFYRGDGVLSAVRRAQVRRATRRARESRVSTSAPCLLFWSQWPKAES